MTKQVSPARADATPVGGTMSDQGITGPGVPPLKKEWA